MLCDIKLIKRLVNAVEQSAAKFRVEAEVCRAKAEIEHAVANNCLAKEFDLFADYLIGETKEVTKAVADGTIENLSDMNNTFSFSFSSPFCPHRKVAIGLSGHSYSIVICHDDGG
jgi:hypothetical protein